MTHNHTKQLLRQALSDLGIAIIDDTALSDLIEIVRTAGEQRGQLEAYDHYMQSQGIDATQREQALARQCHILTTQLERLIRVNRYLFSLLPGAVTRRRHRQSVASKNAAKIFAREPGGASDRKAKMDKLRHPRR